MQLSASCVENAECHGFMVILSAFMLNVFVLSVISLNAVVLIVLAPMKRLNLPL